MIKTSPFPTVILPLVPPSSHQFVCIGIGLVIVGVFDRAEVDDEADLWDPQVFDEGYHELEAGAVLDVDARQVGHDVHDVEEFGEVCKEGIY